jgi:membrane protease YdiL (CAAX protease family)
LVVASAVGIAFVVVVYPGGGLDVLMTIMNDAPAFCIMTIIANVVQLAVLVLAVRLAGWHSVEYLALARPNRKAIMIGVACLLVLLPVSDALTHLAGQPVITPFQRDMYLSAKAAGQLPLLWFVLVIVAPIGEEVTFRGFLQRGWVRSKVSVVPGIVLIAALFTIMHVQYDAIALLQVFALGLLLGWLRWLSGSTTLTILLHGIVNFVSTVQTTIYMEWKL